MNGDEKLKVGDSWEQVTEGGGPLEPFVRITDDYMVTAVYDDGTYDLRLTRKIQPKACVNQVNVSIGFATLCDWNDGECPSTATHRSCTTGKPYCAHHACSRCTRLP